MTEATRENAIRVMADVMKRIMDSGSLGQDEDTREHLRWCADQFAQEQFDAILEHVGPVMTSPDMPKGYELVCTGGEQPMYLYYYKHQLDAWREKLIDEQSKK